MGNIWQPDGLTSTRYGTAELRLFATKTIPVIKTYSSY